MHLKFSKKYGGVQAVQLSSLVMQLAQGDKQLKH